MSIDSVDKLTSVFQNFEGSVPNTLAFPRPRLTAQQGVERGMMDSLGIDVSHTKYFLPRERNVDKFWLDAPAKGATKIGSSFGPAGTVYRTAGRQAAYSYAPVQDADQIYTELFDLYPRGFGASDPSVGSGRL